MIKNIFKFVLGDKIQDIIFSLSLLIIGAIIFFFLIYIKRYTFSQFFTNPFVYSYAILVSLFRISRIIGAILFKHSFHSIVPDITSIYEPVVSFVIPCKNEENVIEKTVSKCFEVGYPKEKIEVIVINDGSTDGTLSMLKKAQQKFPNLAVINWRKNRGKRHGMAAGFRRAKGEIVVQLDSDSFISPQTFRNLIVPFSNPAIGGVSAHTDPENADKNWLTKIQAAYYFVSFRIQKAAESTFYAVFCLSGCCSAYRKEVIMPVLDKFLGERFLGLPITWGDDRSLTNWVLKSGYKTIYTDKVQAYTLCPETLKVFFRQQVRWKKGWFVNSVLISKFILKKHPFVAFTYFFPLFLISIMTPLIAARALFYDPIVGDVAPVIYLLGIFLITAFTVCYYRYVDRRNKYWPYVFVWATINTAVLSFILIYALFTIQNRKWGTR